ncbi:MAG: LpqB family beta-propeller domain-containing protein [Blastocatellales bacterium]
MNAHRMMARAVSGLTVLLFAIAVAPIFSGDVLAQGRAARGEDYVVFVSQRNGAAELYLLDLNTRQVSQLTNTGRGHLAASISAASRSIVFASREGSSYELFSGALGSAWRNRRPTLVGLSRLTVDTMDEVSPTLSSNGAMMAFHSGHGIELMSTVALDRRVVIPSAGEHQDFAPAISPDGSQIAFVSNRGGNYEIWIYSRSGGAVRKLTAGAAAVGGLSWSADAKQIVFTTTATNSKLSGVALADVETGAFRVLTDRNDFNASLSARGDRLLFTSMRDGNAELYLLNLAESGVERLTNNMGLDDGAVFVGDSPAPVRRAR